MKKVNDKMRDCDVFLCNLKSVLKRKGLSQRDFAKMMDKKESEISRWMSGRCRISESNRAKMEQVLQETIPYMVIPANGEVTVRVGIVGTGDMAGRFHDEALHVRDVDVVGAYNPDTDAARHFCDTRGISLCASSVEELFQNVDAVYVASPVETHYEYARKALESGRHVLCEMPFTEQRYEASALLQMAKKSRLTLMPALKTAYCPSFMQVLRVAKLGLIGEVVDVSATVTTLLDETKGRAFCNERMMENMSYPLLMGLKLFGAGYVSCHSFVKREAEKVLFTHASLVYPNAVCDFKVGVGVKSEGSLVISGTHGYVYVPAPWWKPDYFEVRFENPADNKKFFFPYEATGLRYEIQAFADHINRKNLQEYITDDELLKMTELQNKVLYNSKTSVKSPIIK